MGEFTRWLAVNEDVTSQRDGFIQLFQGMFPDAKIDNKNSTVSAKAQVEGRNLVISWYPGTNHRKPDKDVAAANDSYVKIDFFHLQNLSGDDHDPDYVGGISKTGLAQQNSVTFAKTMMQLVRGLKSLGIHIVFDAVGMDRADSYASILKKVGYTLGLYRGQVQMWLAKPVDGMTAPAEDPYAATTTGASRKRERASAAPATPPGSFRIST